MDGDSGSVSNVPSTNGTAIIRGVDFEPDVYMLDIPPYTTPAIELCFELSQQTGHLNKIRLTFTEQGELSGFHLRTS